MMMILATLETSQGAIQQPFRGQAHRLLSQQLLVDRVCLYLTLMRWASKAQAKSQHRLTTSSVQTLQMWSSAANHQPNR